MINYNGKSYTFLAVIPARAGSQGVNGKNYRPLCGRPLIEWSMDAARDCPYVDKTFVSTNDPKIETIVNTYNDKWHLLYERGEPKIEILHRPDNISGPLSHTEEALKHALLECHGKYNFHPDFVITLQPTSPVRTKLLLSVCVEDMIQKGADSLLTVNRHTPLFWRRTQSGAVAINDPRGRKMRQDYSEEEFYFHDNGNLYISSAEAILSGCRVTKNPILLETDPFQSLQIDTESDFTLIEAMARVHGGLS